MKAGLPCGTGRILNQRLLIDPEMSKKYPCHLVKNGSTKMNTVNFCTFVKNDSGRKKE
jgi:hypothetical protein